ncbi:MAG: RIP metalloprotease RseP [Candidatus Doudnabacteria bacterium]
MFFTILIFIIILSLLVFVHELGHFVVAKKSGMKVHEFGFGFPPRVVGIQKIAGKWRVVWGQKSESKDADSSGSDNATAVEKTIVETMESKADEPTIYSINAIPLGGFVRIMGEDNDEAKDSRSFTQKGFIPRFLTLAAGVIMNVLAAWVMISIGFMVGLPVVVDDVSDLPSGSTFSQPKVFIAEVLPDSPAQKAGIEYGDLLLKIDDQAVSNSQEVQNYIYSHQDEQELRFVVKRINQELELSLSLDHERTIEQGVTGIAMATHGSLQFGPIAALGRGAITVYNQLGAILGGLVDVFSSGDGLKSLGGPVKIAQLTGQVADLGIIPLLQFAAFLSLNLAILNTLPFPALDGGRMLFLIIEKLRGKPNNQKIEQYANAIGFLTLLLLMAVITLRDISQIESIKNLF